MSDHSAQSGGDAKGKKQQSAGDARGAARAGHIRKSVSANNVPSVSNSGANGPRPSSSSSAAMWSHVGYHRTTIPPEATFDQHNDQIKKDLMGMIVQYLQQEGFTMSSATIQDEANVKLTEKVQDKDALRRVTKAILDGDWDVVAKLINKNLKKFHSQQGFLYAVCKQEYLELIDRQECQKAFTFLTTHLKPLEKIATMTNRNEFKDLCYLLTCKSVGEVDSFRDWDGVVRSREKLVEQLRSTFELDELVSSDETNRVEMPENRLVNLLHQSVAYQMEFSRYHPKTIPKVTTLLHDFECEVLPNAVKSTYVGHSQNVKYVTFVGHDGEFLASGSSDTTIKLWPVEFPRAAAASAPVNDSSMGEVCETWVRDLRGHSSRIWYLSSNTAGDMLYSGSGDGTVKIWDLRNALSDLSAAIGENGKDDAGNAQRGAYVMQHSSLLSSSSITEAVASTVAGAGSLSSSDCVATLQSHSGGDIYSVNVHPSETHLVTGGYDQTVRLFDIQTGVVSKTFRGHVASVCDAQFNRHANLIVSGSKDGTIRLWDILSGLCVHTLRQTLGEVTSVSMASNGYTLLSGSRNNSNRLWDLRMLNAPRAHLNTHGGSGGNRDTAGHGFATGGSSMNTSHANGASRSSSTSQLEQRPIQRFKGHQNTAKNIVRASFGPRETFVLGGSEDGAVYVWDVATGKLLEKLAGHHGVTYNAKWHEKQALMASSSHDGTVKTWWWQDKKR
uniref:WD40 repeat-containing protein SMU1 n=1 Tax=Globisporangium ultimum (strain ATCC 200006 / CBS 805.95 / DAOM BR144) TaxID=431595 RepID=K3W6D9_GLOUD